MNPPITDIDKINTLLSSTGPEQPPPKFSVDMEIFKSVWVPGILYDRLPTPIESDPHGWQLQLSRKGMRVIGDVTCEAECVIMEVSSGRPYYLCRLNTGYRVLLSRNPITSRLEMIGRQTIESWTNLDGVGIYR